MLSIGTVVIVLHLARIVLCCLMACQVSLVQVLHHLYRIGCMGNGLHVMPGKAHTLVGTARRLHGLIVRREGRHTGVIGLLTRRIGLLTVTTGHLSFSAGPW